MASKRPNAKDIEMERAQFRQLILVNPNYFGNLEEVGLPPVTPMAGNTNYEQLTCVGLQPQLDRLEATVRIKANGGYEGPLCGDGSTEYVRFYISYDEGANWTDLGMESFEVFDTPGIRPLHYAVNRDVPLTHRICFVRNQPRVRAILSWNQPPPADTPNFPPVWGNVVEVSIRPSASQLIALKSVFAELALEVPTKLEKVVKPDAVVEAMPLKVLSLVELSEEYGKEVEPHRFAYQHVQAALASPPVSELQVGSPSELAQIGIDLSDLIKNLIATDGNTDYEELDCIGYDPKEDALVGVLTVKRSTGYGGGRCTTGSLEHVAFWVDWGSGFEYAGTSTVRVHDDRVPEGGLKYAVYQPVPSAAHRRNCVEGPVQPAVRAILSWQTPPPPSNPNWTPTWGNREQGRIQLPAGALTSLRPVVDAISGVAVCAINQATGLTSVGQRPFGGVLTISGSIPGAPDRSAPPMKYRIQVRPVGAAAWQTVNNDFQVWVEEQIGASLATQTLATQSVDGDGFYTYLEDPNPLGTGYRQVLGRLLGQWVTAEPMTGRWEIEVVAKDPAGNLHPAQILTCSDGTTRSNVIVRLDEVRPTSALAITHFVRNGQPFPAQECMKFKVDDVLHGTYSVSDEHFDSLRLSLDPAGPAANTVPVPSGPTAFPSALTVGTSGTWSIHTGLMAPCGYVVRLQAWDRTIVSSSGGWAADEKTLGFSLEA
jgi:hypothetical protein